MDSSKKQLPPIPPLDRDLIKALDARFPAKCPSVKDSERDIWVYVGQRKLVEFLVKTLEEQEENIL